ETGGKSAPPSAEHLAPRDGLCAIRLGHFSHGAAIVAACRLSTVSSAPTDFEIGWFAVTEIVEATKTGWDAGSLALSLPELAGGAGQPALAEVTVDIVRPGDPVRVANVLDAVLPTVRADPATTFPGALGRLTNAGRGRT